MGKFLDYNGLTYFWAKLKAYFVKDSETLLTYVPNTITDDVDTQGRVITIDASLSSTSTNPVQNKEIYEALELKADLTDIPTIPTNVSSFTNDAGYTSNAGTITGITMNGSSKGTSGVVNLGTVLTAHQDISGKANTSDLATVATSGSYTDLDDLPTIPTALSQLTADSTHRLVTDTEKTTWNGKQDTLVSGTSIKTINNQSLLGSGNISISGGSGGGGDINVIEAITMNGSDVPVNDKVAAITFTESDPTVPSWAKASSKPSYTASEVGAVPTTRTVNGKALSTNISLTASDVSALPSSTSIPSKVSDLDNDSGFITSYTETDPVFSASAAADITSTDISTWNGKQNALVSGTNIKTINNQSLLGSGNISISGGGGGITEESDPVFTASPAYGITAANISSWNGKSDFSGSYNDLTNKPTIPTVPTDVSAFTNDAGYITSYTETDPVFSASAAAGITSTNITTWNNKQSAISDLSTIRSNASSGASAASTIAGYGDVVTHDASEFMLASKITVSSSTPSSSTGSNGDIWIVV